MKRLFLLLTLAILTFSCNDDCTQEALSTQITKANSTWVLASGDTTVVCHNGLSLTISVDALQTHLDHGDIEGECGTLSDGGLHFSHGNVVEIDCKYKLPFVHTRDNGEQWIFTSPN